jgi:hypothetical protein
MQMERKINPTSTVKWPAIDRRPTTLLRRSGEVSGMRAGSSLPLSILSIRLFDHLERPIEMGI